MIEAKTHPRQIAQNPEYINKKKEAMTMYMTSDKSIREVESETWIKKSVISRELNKEIRDNANDYQDTLMNNRFAINRISKMFAKKVAKMDNLNEENLEKFIDLALKSQKINGLIEWVDTNNGSGMPSQINIQVINNK